METGRILRQEERSTGDSDEYAGRRKEVQEAERNRQAGRKKYSRQRGICRKEERSTGDREEYAGRRNEDSRQRGICRKEERRTGDRKEYAKRREAGQQAERNIQAGGMKGTR